MTMRTRRKKVLRPLPLRQRHFSRRDLTGRTRREALAIAKTLLPSAKKGNLEDTAMLVDMAVYAGKERTAEALQLALQGLAYPTGERLSPNAATKNLKAWIDNMGRELFPKRRGPCLPNRRELNRLINDALDLSTAVDRKRARDLWKDIKRTCADRSWRNIEGTLRLASDTLRGFGVEAVTVQTIRGPQGDTYFDYVNMGDTYAATLLYDYQAGRFRVTSYGDLIEAWERRWGRADDAY